MYKILKLITILAISIFCSDLVHAQSQQSVPNMLSEPSTGIMLGGGNIPTAGTVVPDRQECKFIKKPIEPSSKPPENNEKKNDLTLEQIENLVMFGRTISNLQDTQISLSRSGSLGNFLAGYLGTSVKSLIEALYSDPNSCENIFDQVLINLQEVINQIETKSCDSIKNTAGCIPGSNASRYLKTIEDSYDIINEALSDTNEEGVLSVCNTFHILKANKNISGSERNDLAIGTLSRPIPNQFVIKFADSVDAAGAAKELATKYNLKILHIYNSVFPGVSVIVPSGVEKKLQLDPIIEKIVPDFTVSIPERDSILQTSNKLRIDPSYSFQTSSSLNNTNSTGISWIGADKNSNEGSRCKVTVAVVDTGLDFNHTSLKANINTSLSRDFTSDGTRGLDNYWHGTFVGGVILGVGSNIELVSVKVLDSKGNGSTGNIIAGIDYVKANSDVIEVQNLSLGGNCGKRPSPPDWTDHISFSSQVRKLKKYFDDIDSWRACIESWSLVDDALTESIISGVVTVTAAGNDNVDITETNDFPSSSPNVITVSALNDSDGVRGNADDKWANWGVNQTTMLTSASNYGSEVDIIAPGTGITSTKLGGGFASANGTSFAAPHVSGTIALHIARNGRPPTAGARTLGYLINDISTPRTNYYSNEPQDGYIEPACWANGSNLKL